MNPESTTPSSSPFRFEVSSPQQWERVVRVEVPREHFDREYTRRLTRTVQAYERPGFRKGKTPRRFVERELGDRLRRGLSRMEGVEVVTPLHPRMSSGLTTFKVEGIEGKSVQDELWRRGRIQPRALREGRGVRYSTHIYNSEDEIDRALRIIGEMIGSA